MKSWIKLYTEILRDPKMGWMDDSTWRTCVSLFLLAGQIDDGGYIGEAADIAWHLRMDEDTLVKHLVALEQVGIVEAGAAQGWHVTNYEERQSRAPSSDPEAIRKRVEKHRSLHEECNEDVTRCNESVTRVKRGVTPSDTDTDTDTESETDTEQMQTRYIDDDVVADDPVIAEQATTELPSEILECWRGLWPFSVPPAVVDSWTEMPFGDWHTEAVKVTREKARSPSAKFYLSVLRNIANDKMRNGEVRWQT